MIPVQNQYVGFGDLIGANEVSTMLSRRTKDLRVRMASAVELAGFEKHPEPDHRRNHQSVEHGVAKWLALSIRPISWFAV